MTYIGRFEGLSSVDVPSRPVHLAMGMFDGVHLGHQSVIHTAMRLAHAEGLSEPGLVGVLTFSPHPSRILRPDSPTQMIMPVACKEHFLQSMGIHFFVTEPFTLDLAKVSAEDFIRYVKEKIPGLASIHVGENFRFGRGRAGDVDALVGYGKSLGVDIVSVERVKHNGEAISSTRIRKELAESNIEEVNHLLGYNYYAEGVIVRGHRLGKELGFPTCNIVWRPELRPRYGVYVVRMQSGAFGVANYGVRPTLWNDEDPLLEVHVLESVHCEPGDDARVEWLSFIRPEMKFESRDALKAQIAKDVAEAKRRISLI